MNSKFIHAKYLAVLLLGIVFLIVAAVDAFSATEINIGSGDVYTVTTSKVIDGKTINAKFNIVKTLRSKNYNLNNCTFSVDLTATSESYSAHCMEAIIKLFVVTKKESVTNECIERVINLDLDFAPIGDLNAIKYGLDELSFSNGVATFETADLTQASNFVLNVKLSASRRLLKDKILLNDQLEASDYTVEKLPTGKARISIDLKRLSDEIEGAKEPTLKVELKTLKAVDVKDSINTPGLANALSASLIIND
jgi:hypothetical protein